jgi:hypothetical protein
LLRVVIGLAWAALPYLHAENWRAVEKRQPVAIVFRDGRAEPMPRRQAKAFADRHDLLVCREAVQVAMRRVRQKTPAVWVGWRRELAPRVELGVPGIAIVGCGGPGRTQSRTNRNGQAGYQLRTHGARASIPWLATTDGTLGPTTR